PAGRATFGRSSRVARLADCCGWNVGRRFASRGNVFRSSLLENVLCFAHPVSVVAMRGHENTAIFHAAFIAFGFIFRDSHANERPNEASRGRADTHSGERTHNRACRDERPEARNRESADACKQSERAAHNAASSCPSSCAFGRLRIL